MAARNISSTFYIVSFVLGALLSSGCTDKSKAVKTTTEGVELKTPQAHAAYVTNNGSDTLSVIDRDGTGVETVAVDIDPDAHEAPHHLALDGKKKRAFVALAFPPLAPSAPDKKNPHGTHGSSARKGKLGSFELGKLSLERIADVDENPGDVVLTHNRSRVLVTHYDMKRAMDVAAQKGASPATMFATLMVFRADDLSLVGSRPVCVAPHAIAVTANDETAFIACYGSDELAVVDLRSDALSVTRIPLGVQQGVPGVPSYGPYSVTLSPDETRAVVGDLEGQDIRVFDVKKREFTADGQIPVGGRAMMPAYLDKTTILLPTQGPDGLLRIALEPSHVEKRRAFQKSECALPHVVRIAKDGRVYLVCEGDHTAKGTVLEIDPVTLDTKKTWTVGVYPDGIAFGDD